jgi:dTDP-4-amino-4,6-dideoxygalactose transaminase
MVTTGCDWVAENLSLLRNHGHVSKYEHGTIGYNGRLDEIQAAMLRVKLKHLDAEIARRRELACAYASRIIHPEISHPIAKDAEQSELATHVFHLFVIRTPRRDALQAHLSERGVQTLIHYPVAIHQQRAYSAWNSRKLALTEALASEVLSLPISPVMSDEEVDEVIDACNAFPQG